MIDALKTFGKTFAVMMTVGMLLVSGTVAGSRFIGNPFKPTPTPPATVAEKTTASFREYGKDLGAVAGKVVERLRALQKAKRESPSTYKPITVQELLDDVFKDSEKARDAYREKLNAFMRPVLGGTEVDPDTALSLFEGMEAGYSK